MVERNTTDFELAVSQKELEIRGVTRTRDLHKMKAVQLNRFCGSGQQAIHFAAQAIAAGDMEMAIDCGVESISGNHRAPATPPVEVRRCQNGARAQGFASPRKTRAPLRPPLRSGRCSKSRRAPPDTALYIRSDDAEVALIQFKRLMIVAVVVPN
jgi:hypothetical protein